METTEKLVELIIRKVPESLRREFKMLCVKEGKTMQDKLIDLMKKEAAK